MNASPKRITLSRLAITIFLLSLHNYSVAESAHARWIGDDFTGKPCMGKEQSYGPFDYTLRHSIPFNLNIVEKAHFNSQVETLTAGQTAKTPYPDLEYTLRAWPNHHRALNSISKYQLIQKSKGKTIPTPAECWFQRAIEFSPKDAMSHMLYGIYLQKSKQYQLANNLYEKALELAPNNIQIHYNYGLLLIDLKKYSLAKEQAKIVYDKNFPLSGLKRKLQRNGYWP